MSKISRPDVTNALVDFFLSAGDNPTPGELSEEVLFTFPFSAPTTQLQFAEMQVFTGAAGDNIVDSNVVPTGEYHLIHAADIDHNDATARPVFFILQDSISTSIVRIKSEASVSSTGFLTIRNVVIPPRWRLRAQLDTIDAAAVMVLRIARTVHKIAQPLMGTSS